MSEGFKAQFQAQKPLEVCGEAGNVLGRFIPVIAERDVPANLDLSEWEIVTPPLSQEERQKRLESTERRFTTTEVIEHLENLRCSGGNSITVC